jgi:ketosteroid isomerase-like protein
MNGNDQIIRRFYTAFQQLDYATMQQCYSEDPVFNDPVFGLLQGPEVLAMWEMLCMNARDFSLSFSDIQLLDEEYATCRWVAVYTFSKTGRKVTNNIKAHLRIEGGRITEHTDQFNFYKWSQQAMGITGVLFGWTNFMQNKVRKSARGNLERFMEAGNKK